MDKQTQHLYEFGDYRLNTAERLLLCHGESIPLKAKVFDMLVLLLENAGHLLEKEWLMEQLWPNSYVEEANLNVNISALRKALGEKVTTPKYIETIPKRGYRFIARVTKHEIVDNIPTVSLNEQDSRDVRVQDDLEFAQEAPTAPAEAAMSYVTKPLLQRNSEAVAEAKPDSGELRPRTTNKMARFSRWQIAASAGLLLLLISAGIYLLYSARSSAKQGNGPALHTLAVLPFKTLSGNEEDNALGLGMADALITRLNNLQELTVRPTSAVLKYSGADQNPIEAGKALGVDAVLTGFVQKDGRQIRISTQITRVADGATLWAERFDDFFTNVFAVQDSISEKMVNALSLRLTGNEKQLLTKRYTENTEAYQLYMQGRYYHHKLITDKALEYYNRALEKDPDYPLPYASLVGVYLGYANAGINRQEYLNKVRQCANKALSLAPNLSEAREALGDMKHAIDWDFAGAEQAYQEALAINPRNESAHYSYSILLSKNGHHEKALHEMELALQLDSVSTYIHIGYADVLFVAGRYDKATEQVNQTLDLDPDFVQARMHLARIYAVKNMYAEAIAEIQKVTKIRGSRNPLLYLAYIYARQGNTREAKQIIETLQQDPVISKSIWNYTYFAMAYGAMGETDKAFELLEKALQERAFGVLGLKVEPEFENLKSDPRYQALIKRIGFPE
jgi:TolB-like protein/DNA-binding winged helix-turn-helix (wHTH) protein/Tfp pilus assembly protein PilF